ncbi:uncharacterized protein LOC122671147 [Telopea speciosissima]|uniref:uncharacterized protein LOC122671147 n=1 Tax=Telopea speciosissima TaxID=54955 RepID=UPI001CC7E50D|nr:uncharacterized protein LOC122671147 [Telopea speciosissima]
MSDWGPVFVAVVLFVLLSPGLLIQVPGRNRFIEFGNFQTSGVSILVHSILYFALICIFLLAVGVHVYIGSWVISWIWLFYGLEFYHERARETMVEWAPVLIGVLLLVILSPGLLFQLPGNSSHVKFGSFKIKGKTIVVHTLIFFAVYAILILAVGVHIYTG